MDLNSLELRSLYSPDGRDKQILEILNLVGRKFPRHRAGASFEALETAMRAARRNPVRNWRGPHRLHAEATKPNTQLYDRDGVERAHGACDIRHSREAPIVMRAQEARPLQTIQVIAHRVLHDDHPRASLRASDVVTQHLIGDAAVTVRRAHVGGRERDSVFESNVSHQ